MIKNPIVNVEMDDLLKELFEENKFLTKLVDTIPAKMYFEQDIRDQITSDKHNAMDKAATDLKRKSNGIELSSKAKHKRARLDPMQQKSISQIQEEICKKEKKVKKHKDVFAPSTSLTRAANIEELQKRLHERISALQAQRKAAGKDPLKNKILKAKMKKLRNKGNKIKASKGEKVENPPKKPKVVPSNTKPVFNKDGSLIYGKLDFSEEGLEDKGESEYSGKKIKTLLKKAEKKHEKIEQLKSSDPEKAKTVEEKEKWKKAILKTKGVKVRDDPNLLKKTLNRKEKQKKKSTKAWQGRKEDIEKRQKARQERRSKNIQMKKKEKFDRKIKSAKKKGRILPGFK